jgi:hypothetical protein
MLFAVIGFFQLTVLIHVIILNIKIIKLVKFHVTSGVVTKLFLSLKKGQSYIFKILKVINTIFIYIYGVFVFSRGGLGGLPSFGPANPSAS